MFLGVDTGGTFTDFVYYSAQGLRFHKVLSTPTDPSLAIEQGIAEMGLQADQLHLVHGSTVATNAVLERKGVKTLFVTNAGFEDLLTIGRQTRAELYQLCPELPEQWLGRDDCVGLAGRIDAAGAPAEPLDHGALKQLCGYIRAGNYDAVAICMLFSFLNPAHEREVAAALPEHLFASASHQVLAEYREYERAATTFLNAYVGPLVQRYLRRLQHVLSPKYLYVMHSAGGVMQAEAAGEHAVRLLLSGPAGGLVAAGRVGRQLHTDQLLTFDMGGTSTDVALMCGEPLMTTEGKLAGLPVSLPMLDIHTIGAGGGSQAWIDEAGLPQVGPQSAGAFPGPVCYGRGGEEVTVTDANLLLGRIPADARLAGSLPLDRQAAAEAFERYGRALGLTPLQAARAVIDIAEEHMAGALRVVSVQKGYDPGDFSLLCFGGAGGLHACALAEKLSMRKVIIPVASGAFSALGMLAGRQQSEFSRTRCMDAAHADTVVQLTSLFGELSDEARQQMPGLPLLFERRVDMRYAGQGFHLLISLPDGNEPVDIALLLERFARAHRQAYGHLLDRPVEVITVRLTACVDRTELAWPTMQSVGGEALPSTFTDVYAAVGDVATAMSVPAYQRSALLPGMQLTGPALVLEDIATTWLPAGWQLQLSPHGHLLLETLV
ncbi:hydantoinase/oxoprolinase family protein [Mariprofundus erugo]|uniref:Hydantoinase/oxoprolinase family protein n=1 Tax=Mariprofundus erugo TaxID=2528639 RepID=A0A5R9GNR5_9PROT|nr:hydantoinase/oxoprolinase family protein [Mariprofundus erugo]TLS67971.1 hydantoinase/oxoprolinase family protein [Mariprofundus erugo]